jgi:tetratricopeptide (TPR) repeat protein
LRQAISLELDISAESKELENPILFCSKRAADGGLPPFIAEGSASIAFMEGEYVTTLLSQALKRFGAGDEADALRLFAEALKIDPGIIVSRSEASAIDELLRSRLSEILTGARFPSTLSSLATLSYELGDRPASDALLSRYLELVPNAPDREHILADRLIRTAIAHAENCRFDLAYCDLRQAISLELNISAESKELEYPVRFCSKRAADGNLPLSIEEAAASIAYMKRNFWRPKRLLRHCTVYFKRIQFPKDPRRLGDKN